MEKQTDPRLMQAIQALASGYARDAEMLCDAVLHEKKRDDLALALRAQACNALGKYEEAMESIRAAIAKNNKRADYHGLLGDMLTTRGDFHRALGEPVKNRGCGAFGDLETPLGGPCGIREGQEDSFTAE